MEAIAFPDAVAAVIGYLKAELAARGEGAGVFRSPPEVRPARFLTVYRLGGTRRNLVVDSPRLAVDGWGRTPEEAHDLLMLARALIGALPGRTVGGVQFYGQAGEEAGGPVDLPDPLSKQPRWSYQPIVHTRGHAV